MSKYKDIIDNMVWSYSRVSTYDHCPYEFFLKYIVNNDDEYLAEGNFFAEVGSFVHSILEKVFNDELKIREMPNYFSDEFDSNVFYEVNQSTMEKTFENCLNYFLEEDFDWLKEYQVIGVEKKIYTDIGGNKFIGFIDLLLRHKETKDIVIVDHKSSAYPFKSDGKSVLKKSKSDFAKYKHQMYLYCKAIYEEYGQFPKYIMWNHFKDKKIAKVDFCENDYHDAIKWFENIIERIKRDENFDAICGDDKLRDKEFFYRVNLCPFRSSCEFTDG